MANCLTNIVGIKGCGGIPETEVYVQQLTGISIADFDLAINNDHKAAFPALQSHIEFATKYVLNSIRQYLGNKYKLKTFLENSTAGYYYDNKPVVSAIPNNLTGIQIKIDRYANLTFSLGRCSLFVDHTGTVDLYVYDLLQGKLLDTVQVEAIAGEIVYFDMNKQYDTEKQRLNLFVGYESTFDAYKSSIYANNGVHTGGCGEWCASCFEGGDIYFRNAKVGTAATKIDLNISDNSEGGGLSLGYALQCSFNEFLCANKNIIAMPILYKIGELVMQELRYSKRLTSTVVSYTGDHAALLEYYKSEHLKLMSDAVQNMVFTDNSCIKCNSRVFTRTALP